MLAKVGFKRQKHHDASGTWAATHTSRSGYTWQGVTDCLRPDTTLDERTVIGVNKNGGVTENVLTSGNLRKEAQRRALKDRYTNRSASRSACCLNFSGEAATPLRLAASPLKFETKPKLHFTTRLHVMQRTALLSQFCLFVYPSVSLFVRQTRVLW